jgi:hypothetical protein
LHLPQADPWTLTDVTDQLIAAGEEAIQAASEAKKERHTHAVQALEDLVGERHAKGTPITKNEAEAFLREHDIGRNEARNLIDMYGGARWGLSDDRRGVPHSFLPLANGEAARCVDPAADAASQTGEPRQLVPQGGEVVVPENEPQARPPETSPPRREGSDNTCATHGEGGMIFENGRWICGICLGMPMKLIELFRQRERRDGPTGED